MSNLSALVNAKNDERQLALLRVISPEACLKSMQGEDRSYLQIPAPQWVTPQEDLRKFFAQYQNLWAGGRVVWAHMIQANNLLFKTGSISAPGEVVFDPTGKTGPTELQTAARALGALKHTQPEDPDLRRIADHLTNEYTRAFAMPVPQSISRQLLLVSTTFFHRPHLATCKLTRSYFPVLINDKYPGVVMVFPERWWPQSLLNAWQGLPPNPNSDAQLQPAAAANSNPETGPVVLKSSRCCSNCKAPMKKLGLAAHYQRKVEIDVCETCSLIWFDETESVRVAGPGVVDLVRLIHKATQKPGPLQPLPNTLPCPICQSSLKHVANISRFGKSSQLECPQRHGALQSFTQFLAEKGYFRPFSWQDIKELLHAGKRPSCVNCGAALEARPHDECPYCRSPVGLLDPARLAQAIDTQGAAPKLTLVPTVTQSECPCCGGAVELHGEMVCPHCMAVIRPVETDRAQAASEKVEAQVRQNYKRQTEDVSRSKIEAMAMLDRPTARLPSSENFRRLAVVFIVLATMGVLFVSMTMHKARQIQQEEGADFDSDQMIGLTAIQKQGVDNARAEAAMKTTPHAPPGEPPPQFDVTQSGDRITLVNRTNKHLRVTLSQYSDNWMQRCYMQNADGPAGKKNVEFKHVGESHDFILMPCPAKVLQHAANEYMVWDLDDGRYIFKSVSAFYRYSVADVTNKQ